MNDKTGDSKIFCVNLANVAACFGVVCLHVNGTVWEFSYRTDWIVSWLIETVFYWPVPVFFMLTGITLMDYRERYDTRTFWKKRIYKIGIPFLVWSLFSVLWTVWRTGSLPTEEPFSVVAVLDMVLNSRGLSIYWFFAALFAVYMAIPVLSLIEKDKRKSAFTYMVVGAAVTLGIFPLFCNLLHIPYNSNLQIPICGGYLLYTVLGYLLYHYEPDKRQRAILYLLGFAGWLLRLLGDGYLSYRTGSVSQMFGGYLNLPCILQSTSVFVFLLQISKWKVWKKPRAEKNVAVLSKLSFGIYLTHYYLMLFLVDWLRIDMHRWQWKLGGSVFVYAISAISVALMKRIPVVKKIVP